MSPQTEATNLKRRALIVDDSPAFRSAFAAMLEFIGWQSHQAPSSELAIQMVKADKPDVLFLDHRMPKMTGTEVYATLRAQGIDIPTAMVSAAREVEHLAQSVGISHWLKKPFTLKELESVLNQLSGRWPGEDRNCQGPA